MRKRPIFSTLVLYCALLTGLAAQSGPERKTPAQVGIDYDIIACRMPVMGNESRDAFPDAANMSNYVGQGTQLIVLHPDGSEEVLFDPGPRGAVVDPMVSFDGRTIYFSRFEDPEDINTQRGITRSPCHIWKLDLKTRQATQLTFGREIAWRDSAHQVDPRYAVVDLTPVELPDGRLLFLSSRDGTHMTASTSVASFPSMKFWRMNADGSNLEPMEAFSQAGCQHPILLMDGRIVWTHFHPTGRRTRGVGNYPLMIAGQDLSDFKTFAGAHFQQTAWHFTTQLSDGDVVTTVYYHQNNFGHGTLVRIPVEPRHPSGSLFGPVSDSSSTWNRYGSNDHFPRVGESLATPWSLGDPGPYGIGYDRASRLLSDGSRAGKATMPAGIPAGDMLFIWSDGRVNNLNRPARELPHMKIAWARGGTTQERDDLVVLKEDARYQYMYPKALVTYREIYGIEQPAYQADVDNEASTRSELIAGGPFATMGTSSVYNRESRWPGAYDDDWDRNLTNDYSQNTAVFIVGQDSYDFSDEAIFAAQVVADMTRVDRRYATLAPGFRSHHNGEQLWGILGEVPLRKFDERGRPILDRQGNPDTSYEVRIPAQVPVHNRVLDRNGLMLTAEQTWHSARPGERKNNCGGCHAHSTDVSPLSFKSTEAARPQYPLSDFALKTPMMDLDELGQFIFEERPERVRLVEYHRDVKPIFEAKCIGCHGNQNPAGGLDLEGDDAVDALAFEDPNLWGAHQATRWIRKHAATQSLLAWKVFGERLDGRDNADRNDDVDFLGTVMPPPGSGVEALSFAEKRTIGLWIDLGCLTDLTPDRSAIGDPFDDQMKPTLVVGGVLGGNNLAPLPPLRLGVYDLHSGVAPDSLEVIVTPNGGTPSANLAAGRQVADGDVLELTLPSLAPDQAHRIDIGVADLAGNIRRRALSVRPTPTPELTVGSLQRGQPAWLQVRPVLPGDKILPFYSRAGTGSGPCPPELGGLCLDLLEPVRRLPPTRGDANGLARLEWRLPVGMPAGTIHLQAVVMRTDPSVAFFKTSTHTVLVLP